MKQFELVQAPRAKRSAFDLSHERKTTLNMGELVPVMCHEILPGDRMKIDFEAFLRTLPLVSPVMHRVNMYAHAYFVPMRLTLKTERWENFITGKVDDTLPYISELAYTSGGYEPKLGDLLDHLGYGVPSFGGGSINVAKQSQLPLRAYHKIWNDYFRDQNFQPEYDILNLPDIIDNNTLYNPLFTLRLRAWEKDYFTAALPTQQRGGVVRLPLGDTAPVNSFLTDEVGSPMVFSKVAGGTPDAGNTKLGLPTGEFEDAGGHAIGVVSGLEADLTQATGSSIAALRRAFALNRWLEASMRFGQRYVEMLRGIFGVVGKDARLQRAEFLGGGSLPVQIGEVFQTSSSGGGSTTPQGTMAGKAMSAGQFFHIDRSFDEHGYLFILVSVLPRTSYDSIALRQNFKLDKFDFAFPQLAHLSEQPVFKAELVNNQLDDAGHEVFGYQPMYSEYRYIPDSVHGDFKGSLAYWSLARHYDAVPALDADFIQCVPPNDIWPVEDALNQVLMQSYAKVTAIRPLPKFGTPI